MTRRFMAGFALLFASAWPQGAAAQAGDAATDVVRFPEAEEIALARSAAPPEVSSDATIWVLRDGGFEVAVPGQNGNHCFVQRSHPTSVEPVCYDAEAAATVLRWEFEHFALRTSGLAEEQLEARLAEAVGSGRLPVPRRPAMSYMLSSAQRLYDTGSGRNVGSWRPHLMLYVPYLRLEDLGPTRPSGSLSVARPGTPMAHLIIVVPSFVDPEQP